MNKELKPAKTIFYILLIAPFFQVELLENLIPLMGKGYTLWQLLAGAAFVYVWSRDKVRIRDFSWIHLLFAALLLVMVIGTLMNPEAGLKRAVQYSYGSLAVGIIAEYGIRKDRENFLTGMEVLNNKCILTVRVHINMHLINRDDVCERKAIHLYKAVKDIKDMSVRSVKASGY